MSAELDVRAVGERALRVSIGADVDRAALVRALRAEAGVLDACATETHALVLFEGAPPDLGAVLAAASRDERREAALHVVEIVLDGADGAEVVRATGLGSEAALARALEESELTVSFLGFCPGFAYLRGLDPRLARLERRASPRAVVPAGSLGIAGGFAGIYPFATPGGWNLVGRALGPLFEAERARFSAGDRVRLVVVQASAGVAAGELDAPAHRPGLRVLPSAPVFVQDLGRPGRLAEGIPRGGALVPGALVRANRLAGADDGAAALERFGPLVLEAEVDARLATDDGVVHELRAGERARLEWGPGRRVGYVAVGGGLDVPSVLGGRGTLVSAGLGGHHGRALRRGDVLAIGERRARPRALVAGARPRPTELVSVHVVPGPDPELCAPDALARLCASEWRVSHQSSRTGIRLEGPSIEARGGVALRTVPMVAGAIELPPAGAPIVLGPEHPTTGGYPVLCVATQDGLEDLCAAPVGATVRFVAISAPAARARRATLARDG